MRGATANPQPERGAAQAPPANWRIALVLWVFALVVHALWAFTIPEPIDWDPAYYRSVARNLADGNGAVSNAVWNLLWIPGALPYPADIYWMPLPSRVLVPGVWLWRAHGDQLVTICLGAAWAPLAYLIGTVMGESGQRSATAGALAATGLCYARFLSTPDCIALYGVIGGLAWLAMARQHALLAFLLAAAAALTRNDGFLLGPCLAFGLSGRRAIAVAVAGPAAAAMWHLRNAAIVGDGYWAARTVTANVVDTQDLLGLTLGTAEPLSLVDRLAFVATEGISTALLVWAVALPVPSIALWYRREPWTRAPKAFWLLMPFVTQFMAPGVGSSGSVYRSASALFPLACVLAVAGLASLGRWASKKRSYHPYFLPGLLGGSLFLCSYLLMIQQAQNSASPLDSGTCALLREIPREEPVMSVHPLLVEAHCQRPAVVLVRGMAPARVSELTRRFAIRYALVMPDNDGYGPAPRVDDAPVLLPGWERVSGRLFRAPSPERDTVDAGR